MREILKKLLGGWHDPGSWKGVLWGRGIKGLSASALDDLNDAQLRDIGLWRDGEHRYRKLREPVPLSVLFPRTGGTPAGDDNGVRSGPTRPRKEKADRQQSMDNNVVR